MRTADQLREDEAALEQILRDHEHDHVGVITRVVLRSLRAEIAVLELRDLYPLSGDEFFVVGPNGVIYRATKERQT